MQQAKDFLNKKILKGNEKKKSWDKIISVRLKWWEHEYKRINNATYFSKEQKIIISDEIQQMTKLETDGGQCPKCDKEWIEINFNNVFGSGKYFEPSCQCYYKCPRCKKHLYDMYVTTRLKMNKYTCHSCGWVLLFDGDIRFGTDYEVFYDNQIRKPININIEKTTKDKKERDNKKKK